MEGKIFREYDQDFTDEQYLTMTEYVHDQLNTVLKKSVRTEVAIKKWLTGETIAPSDWSLFGTLANMLDAKSLFVKYETGMGDSGSYRRNYRIYTTVRKGVMAYLTRLKGIEHAKKKMTSEEEEDTEHISLLPEINIIIHDLMQDIDKQTAVARVKEIKEIQSHKKAEDDEELERRLRRGVVTRERGQEYKKTSLTELEEAKNVIYQVIRGCLLDTAVRNAYADYENIDIISYLLQVEGVVPKPHAIHPSKRGLEIAKKVHEDMSSGKIDDLLKLPKGTMHNAYNQLSKLCRIMPNDYYRCAALHHEIARDSFDKTTKREQRRAKEAESNDSQKKLLRRYNFDLDKSKTFATYELDLIANASGRSVEELLEDKRVEVFKGIPLFTRSEVEAILKEHNLSELMRFIHPNNFVLDL